MRASLLRLPLGELPPELQAASSAYDEVEYCCLFPQLALLHDDLHNQLLNR